MGSQKNCHILDMSNSPLLWALISCKSASITDADRLANFVTNVLITKRKSWHVGKTYNGNKLYRCLYRCLMRIVLLATSLTELVSQAHDSKRTVSFDITYSNLGYSGVEIVG